MNSPDEYSPEGQPRAVTPAGRGPLVHEPYLPPEEAGWSRTQAEETTAGTATSQAPVSKAAPVAYRPAGVGGFRLRELIWLSVAVVDAFLGLDFLFRAIAAGPSGFVSVVERVGDALASPFAGLFSSSVPQVGHTTDWAALVAIVVYTLAALIVARLVAIFSRPVFRRASGV